jgi:hypothetical protein
MREIAITCLLLTLGGAARAQEPTSTTPPPAERAPEEGMPRTAFVFEASLAGGLTLAGATSGAVVVPGLVVGVRLLNRLQLGLRLFVTGVSNSVPNTSATSTTAVLIGPEAKVDIVQAARGRVAFYAKLGLLPGDAISVAPLRSADNNLLLGLDVGFGMRYAPVRYFAFGAEAGSLSLFITPNHDTRATLETFYGAVVGTFMFGR